MPFFFVFSFRNHLFRLHLEDLSLIQVGENVYVYVFSVFLFRNCSDSSNTQDQTPHE